MVNVRMQVKNMSFSAHADARGIMQMIRTTQPLSVVLVHGEAPKMAILSTKIVHEMGIPCFYPANGEMIHLPSSKPIPAKLEPNISLHGIANSFRVPMESIASELKDSDTNVAKLLTKLSYNRASRDIPLSNIKLKLIQESQKSSPIIIMEALVSTCCGGSNDTESLYTATFDLQPMFLEHWFVDAYQSLINNEWLKHSVKFDPHNYVLEVDSVKIVRIENSIRMESSNPLMLKHILSIITDSS